MKKMKKSINALTGLVQYHVATLVDNELANVHQSASRSGRPLKVIRQRLKGKEGRLRMNIMGKRVDFSARTVISVDPNISIDEYGVPERIAMNLTVPETVTKYNIKKMYKYVRNGPYKHPGARQITKNNYDSNGKPSPESISLKYIDRESVVLEIGDVIERHLIDGDIALFNRQPTLHRMSMMGHRIKVMKGLTFRLNVFVCKPYGADFDGDEMNMHVPQTIQTQYELENIALVPLQIISPASAMPIIYVVQDSLSAAYLFSQPENRISKKELFNLLIYNKNFNGILPSPGEDNKWNGYDVLTTILPDISSRFNNNSYEDHPLEKNKVIIKNGKYIQGVLDKKALGDGQSSIINTIFKTYGPNASKDFLDNLQRFITRWFTNNGFSLGIGDTVPKLEVSENVKETILTKVKEVNSLIKSSNEGTYNPNLDPIFIKDSLELDIIGILDEARNKSNSEVKKNLPESNRFNICVSSGAKGKSSNIGQVMALVGQQSIEGKRVPFGFTNRTLPSYSKDDYGAESRGFVRNAFINGLEPTEFFFHQMGGRTGLIDTAIKTAESGYIQRRLIKAIEDVSIKYDGTVRNSANSIIEFSYGDDSINSTKLEKVKLEILEMNDKQLQNKYLIDTSDMKILDSIMDKSVLDEINKDKSFIENMKKDYDKIYNFRENCRNKYFKNMMIMDTTVVYPVNFYRTITSAIFKFNISKNFKSDLHPYYINSKIEELLNYLKTYVNNSSLKMFEIGIYSYLSPKVSILHYKLTKTVFDFLIESFKEKYVLSLVQPGEMVGILAAQSIGESLTQMTLNTFHNAGVGANSIITTQGVPRMREIINVAKQIKTPSLTIYLNNEYSKDMLKAKSVMTELEYTKIEDIVMKTQILYESDIGKTNFNEDLEFIQTYMDFADIIGYNQYSKEESSKWILRIVFDKDAMMNKNIYLSNIQDTLMKSSSLQEDIQCVFSDDNASELIMRVNIKDDNLEEDNYLQFLQELEKIIMGITLRGIENIQKVVPMLEKKLEYMEDGSYNQIDEWILATNGVNLLDTLIKDYVDDSRTVTNDIHEMNEVFGIEAARNSLINELEKQLQSNNINHRHISMLIDLMTYKGYIMPIERHGINRSVDTGPIAKSTFEESTEILVKASTYAEVDDMKGVSANIMMAQLPKVGTNSFDIFFDEEKFINTISNKNEEPEIDDEIETVEKLEKEISEAFKDNTFDNLEDKFEMNADITNNEEEIISSHIISDDGFNVIKGKSNKKVKIKISKK